MWELEKEFTFEASHRLPHHDGKCARLHGHSWLAVVRFVGKFLAEKGPRSGMVVDYADIKAVVGPIVEEKLDHYHLNDTTGLESPTSEELARWLYQQISDRVSRAEGWPVGVRLDSVSIRETCTAKCTYRKTR